MRSFCLSLQPQSACVKRSLGCVKGAPGASHLHLLVDLSLHGVRWFPAAFIFWGSALLHLWHSPPLAGSRTDECRPSAGAELTESLRVEVVTLGDSGCHSRTSESVIQSFAPFESGEHACRLRAAHSAAEQSPLFPHRCQAHNHGWKLCSGGVFQNKSLMIVTTSNWAKKVLVLLWNKQNKIS